MLGNKKLIFINLYVLVFLFFLISGCTIKLIASYDETIDKNVTALHKKVEQFFVKAESTPNPPVCNYENHKNFYDEAKVDISAIKVRAAAIPKNEITTKQISLLTSSLRDLEDLHKLSCLSKAQIETLRTAFNTSFTAILKLELAKKRGEK